MIAKWDEWPGSHTKSEDLVLETRLPRRAWTDRCHKVYGVIYNYSHSIVAGGLPEMS